VTTLVWDAQDRLMSLTEPDGTVWRYTYDALDRRVRIAVDDGVTVSVRAVSYDAKLAVALWSWDGSTWRVVEDYVVGAGFGEVLAKSTPSGPQYALRDHLQTPVAWVGADGTVSETPRDSYGVRADGSAGITVTEPYGYTGHAEDGHGLVWGRCAMEIETVGDDGIRVITYEVAVFPEVPQLAAWGGAWVGRTLICPNGVEERRVQQFFEELLSSRVGHGHFWPWLHGLVWVRRLAERA
jgi:YD repeat-containing protein